MTVSRRGKHGTRAGGKNTRPASRNRRVVGNARLAAVAREFDTRPIRNRTSKEEWVIHCVSRAIGTRSNLVTADDIASDILLELLDAGGFSWEEEEIEEFCRKKTCMMVLKCLHRRERPECEFIAADDEGREWSLLRTLAHVPAAQHTAAEAREAVGFLRALPNRQRRALEVLCDGGNPLDVAEELGVTPWEAIRLIREGRDYVGRVDPR